MSVRHSRFMVMFSLVFAGEIIFSLPFHVPRFFRPTMLDVFNFTNTQLGDVFAAYGLFAMLSYFPGGAIADRFSDRKLMTLSLIATAAGGIFIAGVPVAGWSAVIYAYWGVTSILLFWGAMIRATRDWGGKFAQGRAFGVLDGGRGLVAATAATIAVGLLSALLPENVDAASSEQRRAGLQAVIYFYTALTLSAAVLIWWCIPESDGNAIGTRPNPLKGMLEVLRRPIVWTQAAIVVCAYCGYKGLDNYSLYAVQVLGMDEVEGARLTAYGAYIRPVAAVAAGLLADRFAASRIMGVTFAVLSVSYTLLFVAEPSATWLNVIYANIFISFFGVYALRGVYFALLEEVKTPVHLTGTTVGLISLVGYTPDVFFAAIGGRILDASPGVPGHQNYFAFLAAIMLLGVLAVAVLIALNRRARISANP